MVAASGTSRSDARGGGLATGGVPSCRR